MGVYHSHVDVDVLLSSERLDSLMEADICLSLFGMDEGGGMLMFGVSMVVLVRCATTCTPFLRENDASVADNKVCVFNL